MPRTKGGTSSLIQEPSRVQDHTGLADRIAETVIEEFVAPLEERVEIIEQTLSLAALSRGVVYELVVPLVFGRRGGTTIVELPAETVEDAVGRPALVNQAPQGDSDEGGIVNFTGDVIDRKHLRVRWFCAFPAPRVAKVVYLIG